MSAGAPHVIEYGDGGRLELGRVTAVMGVINLTPDSFSDGGRVVSAEQAADLAARMAEDGAALVDVGGESTRPGASPVSAEEETRRVVPAISLIKKRTGARVSIDTRKAVVARAALDAGADLVNDVSALGDPAMADVLRRHDAPVVLMHMRGEPATMQRDTRYDDVVREVRIELGRSVESAVSAGVVGAKILVDPGIGFGKSVDGNLEILRRLSELLALSRPILVGASRKSFIGKILELETDERLEGGVAVAVWAAAQGAHVIRTHDVRPTLRALRVLDAIRHPARSAAQDRAL